MEKLAIRGGKKVREKSFPSFPIIRDKEKNIILEVFENGKWARTGINSIKDSESYIFKFENACAKYHGQKYALSVSNCTVALELAMSALGIGIGDEVIVTSYSFISSVSCVLRVGAKPVFADIDCETWNISCQSIRKCITKDTKAIIVVHFAGQCADMHEISCIAKQHNLKIVSDSAHTFSSKWDNLSPTIFSDITCFSFQHSKNISCGEGGLIITSDEAIYNKLFSLHMSGRNLNGSWYNYNELGSNFKITEFQAALAYSQLEDHRYYEEIRNQNANYLISNLNNLEGIILTRTIEKAKDRVYHLFTFSYIKEKWDNLSKKRFILALNSEGIPCHGGYEIPIYKNPLFKRYKEFQYINNVNAEKVASEAVWIHQNILLGNRQDMCDIIYAIKKIRENYCELISKK